MNIVKFKELDSTEERRGIKAKIVPITRSKLQNSGSDFLHKKDGFFRLLREVPNDGHLNVQLVNMMVVDASSVSLCQFCCYQCQKEQECKEKLAGTE